MSIGQPFAGNAETGRHSFYHEHAAHHDHTFRLWPFLPFRRILARYVGVRVSHSIHIAWHSPKLVLPAQIQSSMSKTEFLIYS